MTYNEKKSFYESIMKEAAKTVKRMINEAGVASLSSDHKEYVESAKRVLNLNQINNFIVFSLIIPQRYKKVMNYANFNDTLCDILGIIRLYIKAPNGL